MAGDWIKMRTSLLTNPKVNGIAKFLEESHLVTKALSTGFNGHMSAIVTRNVMRHVTVSSLLVIWGAANEHTRDGVFNNSDLEDLDDMTGIPEFGEALSSVGWAVYDPESKSVTLPNFNEYNTSGAERSASSKTAAQRQKEYRERKSLQLGDVTRDVTSDVTSNRREEKRREEKKEQKQEKNSSPTGSRLAPDWVLPDDWKVWAEQERPDLDVFTQAASFADYWHGVAGAKGRKADWLATWRNWIRNSNSGSRPRAGPAFPPQKSKALQAIEKLQGINNGLAQNGNQHRVIEADIARIGMGSGDGRDGRYGGGMDGSIDP